MSIFIWFVVFLVVMAITTEAVKVDIAAPFVIFLFIWASWFFYTLSYERKYINEYEELHEIIVVNNIPYIQRDKQMVPIGSKFKEIIRPENMVKVTVKEPQQKYNGLVFHISDEIEYELVTSNE